MILLNFLKVQKLITLKDLEMLECEKPPAFKKILNKIVKIGKNPLFWLGLSILVVYVISFVTPAFEPVRSEWGG